MEASTGASYVRELTTVAPPTTRPLHGILATEVEGAAPRGKLSLLVPADLREGVQQGFHPSSDALASRVPALYR